MKKMTKQDGSSLDMVNGNLEALKAIFPEAFTEDGVDFEVLRQLLGDAVEEGEEKYGLTWHGKKKARQIALMPSLGTLRPCPEESVDWDTTQNLCIEGDNLEVLKLLQKSYANKIKMIYIDPPYNTGKEFIYPDKFQDNLDTYLRYTGQKGDEGFKLSSNTESSGRYHTNWLNMMYPRLKLARNLLREDGVIFISIDDNEVANLRKLCDEIFGEENFVANVAVKLSEATGVKMAHAKQRIPKLKEYVMVYKKLVPLSITPAMIDKEKWDSEYRTASLGITKNELRLIKEVLLNEERTENELKTVEKLLERLTFENVTSVCQKETGNEVNDEWLFNNAYRIVQFVTLTGGARQYASEKKNSFRNSSMPNAFSIVTPKKKMYAIKSDFNDESELPRCKILFADQYLQVNSGDFWQDIKTTGLDNEGYVDFKNGKKPLKMINRCLGLLANKEDIIVDFFAGSCTTAQAVLDLNKEDGGNRKFIMVQLPEPTYEFKNGKKIPKKGSEGAFNAGHETIFELAKERIRRAAAKIKEKNSEYEGDLGFKVFKLNSSNIRAWNPDRNDLEQTLIDHMEHLVEGRSEEDVLYELLLKRGVDLTVPIEEKTITGKTVYSIGYGVLFACLDTSISHGQVEPLAMGIIGWHKELEPASDTQVVFRDSAFESDIAKTNMTAILEQHGIAHVRSL